MKIFGFAGWSGSGKTTLIEQLIPRFVKRGLRVSLIKHAHHTFDVDQPGKDSYRHRHAGAGEVLVTSSRRWVLMHELRGAPEPSFDEQVRRLSPCDLLLVEGFKHAAIPKLEVWRTQTGEGLLHPNDPHIVAVASDAKVDTKLPLLDLNDADGIAQFIVKKLELRGATGSLPSTRRSRSSPRARARSPKSRAFRRWRRPDTC
jgi:molybdopterin-guanine dinucleotide biosynthesis protein B